MDLIRPNCRDRLTSADLNFIGEALAPAGGTSKLAAVILNDSEMRDRVLDNPKLFHALVEWHATLTVSTHLYFYIMVRHTFLKKGLSDRDMADYAAAVLSDISLDLPFESEENEFRGPVQYFVDLIGLEKTGGLDRFLLQTWIGNYSLFLTSMFKQLIRSRTERKAAPDVAYYEEIGKSHFHSASLSQQAGELDLEGLYLGLSNGFTEIRRSLNDMVDQHLFLHQGDDARRIERLIQALGGANPPS